MSMFLSNRPVQKVLLKNTTRLSLHERFTYLRNNVAEASGSGALQRQRELQQQTARNRRIAMQMERRPAVMAALKLKKKSLRQRLGMTGIGPAGIGNARAGTSIKDRLSLGRPGRRLPGQGARGLSRMSLQQSNLSQIRRGRQRGRGMQGGGGGGRGSLSRSQSTQSLNNAGRFTNRARSRSRSRSRVRTNSISNNNNSNNQRFRNRIPRGGRGGGNPRFMQQKQRGGRGGGNFRGRGGNWGTRGRGDRGKGMRGGLRRGRGGQRGQGRRQNTPAPTKEELDNQLDQYMANSRFGLDKDLDTYMKQATSLGTTSSGATPMEESWD